MYDVMVIGGGPAGLSACVYTARKQLKTILISSDIGGQINWTMGIENYLGYQFIEGQELIAKFQEQVSQFPIEQQIGVKVTGLSLAGSFEAIIDSREKVQAKTVILATGKKPRRLEIPGEVEFTGKGVSYCAICDGPVFAGQTVVIAGGGNSAIQAALDMVKIARQVYLVSLTDLTADPILTGKLPQMKNLSILIRHRLIDIQGQQFVNSVTIQDIQTKQTRRLEVTGVFVEIGLTPNSDLVRDLIPLNERGEVPVTCSGGTSLPGCFAGGDVTDVPGKQILIAAGEGAKAALQAHRYIQRLE